MEAIDPDDLIEQLRAVQSAICDHAITVAKRVAKNVVRKYPWLDADDMQQELMLRLAKWVDEYKPQHASSTKWSKYLYHKMTFYSKDVLRREDPLGISWPQRKHYPAWYRLGENSSRAPDKSNDESAMGSDCSVEQLGRALEFSIDSEEGEDEAIWAESLKNAQKWADSLRRKQRRRKPLPILVESGRGCLRQDRLPYWDQTKNRVKFRTAQVRTISDWLACGVPEGQLSLF